MFVFVVRFCEECEGEKIDRLPPVYGIASSKTVKRFLYPPNIHGRVDKQLLQQHASSFSEWTTSQINLD